MYDIGIFIDRRPREGIEVRQRQERTQDPPRPRSSSIALGPVIAYDMTRLFLGPLSRSPRGIDRVDLALARYLFADERTHNVGILPTPWGVRTYEAARVRRGIAHVSALWAEGAEGEHDPRWPALVGWLRTGSTTIDAGSTDARRANDWGTGLKLRRMLGELRATGFALGASARTRLPAGAIYLNVGQIGLAIPAFHRWQGRRPDVTVVTMLHDTIPIDHPQHVHASSTRHHRQMVRTAARYSHALIVTTEHARHTVAAEMDLCGARALPTLVRKLPLPRSLTVPRASESALADVRYFVCCGSIEPRKNHALLFAVWRKLARRPGATVPRLVLVGSAGFAADAILRPLAGAEPGASMITHVAGLSSPALARLMLGATAILCPSLAEGFGLPLYEANALKLPTIASDIPSHREIADAATTLLDPGDIEGWAAAINAAPLAPPRRTPPIDPELEEDAYCRVVFDFLVNSATRRQRR